MVIPWGNKGVAWRKRMQGTMPGARRRGRTCTAWIDNIKTWIGLSVEEWPTLGSRTAKEQNRTELATVIYNKCHSWTSLDCARLLLLVNYFNSLYVGGRQSSLLSGNLPLNDARNWCVCGMRVLGSRRVTNCLLQLHIEHIIIYA